MARYHLNDALLFDDESFQISSLTGEPPSVRLSVTASRCLALFIERQGEAIDKETLLQEGWGKYGVQVTDGSMWKTISQLRQTFTQFGVPYDVIVTVPRLGYTFTSEMKITLIEPGADSTSLQVAETAPTDGPPVPASPISRITGRVWIAAVVLVNALAAAGYAYFAKPHDVVWDKAPEYRLLETREGVNLYLQEGVDSQSAIVKLAVERLSKDMPDNFNGQPVRYIYINKVLTADASIYFLCNAPIDEKNNGCSAYTLLQNG